MSHGADPRLGRHSGDKLVNEYESVHESDHSFTYGLEQPPLRKHSQDMNGKDADSDGEGLDMSGQGLSYEDAPKQDRLSGRKSFNAESSMPLSQNNPRSVTSPILPIQETLPLQSVVRRQSIGGITSGSRPPLDPKVKSLARSNSSMSDGDVNQRQLTQLTDLMQNGQPTNAGGAVNINSIASKPVVGAKGTGEGGKFEYPSQVSDFIYVGGVSDARNRARLTSLRIEYIQNLAPSTVPNFFASDFIYKTVGTVKDGTGQLSWVDEAFAFLDIVREADGFVLVHDEAGTGRSVAVVILYMCKTYDLSLFEGYSLVKSKRRETKLSALQLHQMGNWEVRTLGQSTLAGVVLVAKKKDQKDELTGVITLKQARVLADEYEQTIHEQQHAIVNVEQQRRKDVVYNQVELDRVLLHVVNALRMMKLVTYNILQHPIQVPNMQVPYIRAWDACIYRIRPQLTAVLNCTEAQPDVQSLSLYDSTQSTEVSLMQGSVGSYKGSFYYLNGVATRGYIFHLLPWLCETPVAFEASPTVDMSSELENMKLYLIKHDMANHELWLGQFRELITLKQEHDTTQEMVQYLHTQYQEQCKRTQYVIHQFESTLGELEDDTGQSFLKQQVLEQQLQANEKEISVQHREKQDLLHIVRESIDEVYKLRTEQSHAIAVNMSKEHEIDHGEHSRLIQAMTTERQQQLRRISKNQHAVAHVEEKLQIVENERKMLLYTANSENKHSPLTSKSMMQTLTSQEQSIDTQVQLQDALKQRIAALTLDSVSWRRKVGKLENERMRREAQLVQVQRMLAYRAAVLSLGVMSKNNASYTNISGEVGKVRVNVPGDRAYVHEQARFQHAAVVAERNDEFSQILPIISAKVAPEMEDTGDWMPTQRLFTVLSQKSDELDVFSKLSIILSPVQAQMQQWLAKEETYVQTGKQPFQILEEYKRVFRMYQLQHAEYHKNIEMQKQLQNRVVLLEREVDKTEQLDGKLKLEEEISVLREQVKSNDVHIFNLREENESMRASYEDRMSALQTKMVKVYEGGLGLKDEWSERFQYMEGMLSEGQQRFISLQDTHKNTQQVHEKEMEEAAQQLQNMTGRYNEEIQLLENEKQELRNVFLIEKGKMDAEWRGMYDALTVESNEREAVYKEQISETQAKLRSLEILVEKQNTKLVVQKAKMESLKRGRENAISAVQTLQAHQHDQIQTSNEREAKLVTLQVSKEGAKRVVPGEREDMLEAKAADQALKLEQSKSTVETYKRRDAKTVANHSKNAAADCLLLGKELSRTIRPWLGISVHTLRVGPKQLLVVSHVGEGSAANLAGVFERDVLLVLGGKQVKTTTDQTNAAKTLVVGSSTPIVLLRGLVTLDGSLDESHTQHIFLNLDLLAKDYDFHMMRRLHRLTYNDVDDEYAEEYRPHEKVNTYTVEDFNFLVNLKADFVGKKHAKASATSGKIHTGVDEFIL